MHPQTSLRTILFLLLAAAFSSCSSSKITNKQATTGIRYNKVYEGNKIIYKKRSNPSASVALPHKGLPRSEKTILNEKIIPEINLQLLFSPTASLRSPAIFRKGETAATKETTDPDESKADRHAKLSIWMLLSAIFFFVMGLLWFPLAWISLGLLLTAGVLGVMGLRSENKKWMAQISAVTACLFLVWLFFMSLEFLIGMRLSH